MFDSFSSALFPFHSKRPKFAKRSVARHLGDDFAATGGSEDPPCFSGCKISELGTPRATEERLQWRLNPHEHLMMM